MVDAIKTQNEEQLHKAWVDQIQQGALAEEKLFTKFHPRVERYVFSRLKEQADDLQDIVQEVLTAALTNFRRRNFSLNTALPSYMYGIAKNKVAAYINKRAKRRQTEVPLDDTSNYAFGGGAFEDILIEGENMRHARIARLRECIDKLKPKYKQIIELKYLKGIKSREIQKVLDLDDEHQVNNLTAYARSLLKNCLEG
ncbi:MAG: RNA polymerase sigma factor [bacterium]